MILKRLLAVIALLGILVGGFDALAVSDRDMERARVIATQAYLRYANDGSGYLDDLKPTTMQELEKSLKAKEKENIKAFKAIPVPSDYKTWTKEQLVEFWGTKAFASKGLTDKGRIGKSRARKQLAKLTVEAPAASAPEKAAPASAEKPTPAEEPVEVTPAANAAPENTGDAVADSLAGAMAEAELLASKADELADLEEPLPKAENHTWVYIVVLCILVGVVVALVVFASNVMKKNEQHRLSGASLGDLEEAANAELKKRFESAIAAKNAEIKSLNNKIELLLQENAALKKRAATPQPVAPQSVAKPQPARPEPQPIASQRVIPQPQQQPQPRAVQPQQPTQVRQQGRPIFLGHANKRGLFVRADRTVNPENTVFRLDTSDGYAGTFRVVTDPEAMAIIVSRGVDVLEGGCIVAPYDELDPPVRVVTDSAGTAISEGGIWKVIRKAKVHFE